MSRLLEISYTMHGQIYNRQAEKPPQSIVLKVAISNCCLYRIHLDSGSGLTSISGYGLTKQAYLVILYQVQETHRSM